MDYALTEKYQPTEDALAFAREKADRGDLGVIVPAGRGQVPVLFARGKGLAEAWENALFAVWCHGALVGTQYDKPEDPPSKDCTMTMVIEDPAAEPMIHRSFPGGLEDLEEYRQEVVDGIKNHWIRDPENPDDTRWEYTYNERMMAYRVPGLDDTINQFDAMAESLADVPITRRAQMISWQPWMDIGIHDPACWQSYWGRIMRDSGAEIYSDVNGQAYLNLNMRFRSRDAYKAAFMNDFAFIDLGRRLADKISEIRGEEVRLGRFIDQSDSFHIYGSYFDEFVDSFLNLVSKRNFEDRTWRSDDPMVQTMFEEARPMIKDKVARQDANRQTQENL
jgi:thymidylate synthase